MSTSCTQASDLDHGSVREIMEEGMSTAMDVEPEREHSRCCRVCGAPFAPGHYAHRRTCSPACRMKLVRMRAAAREGYKLGDRWLMRRLGLLPYPPRWVPIHVRLAMREKAKTTPEEPEGFRLYSDDYERRRDT